jgi:antitoxin HicB
VQRRTDICDFVLHNTGPALNFIVKGAKSTMKFRVVLQQDEDGVFVAEVPSLPGCISQGMTRAKALDNIREAIEGYLASLKEHGEPIPPPIDEEVVDVSV